MGFRIFFERSLVWVEPQLPSPYTLKVMHLQNKEMLLEKTLKKLLGKSEDN